MDTMATAHEADRHSFLLSLQLLNAVDGYAVGLSPSAPRIEGLSTPAYRLLNDPEIGRQMARSWSVVFADTIALLNRFKNEDMVRRRHIPDQEYLQVQQTAEKALSALVGRLNGLANSVA